MARVSHHFTEAILISVFAFPEFCLFTIIN